MMHKLPQINLFPTSTVVVRETLKRVQLMAAECNMTSISVTYDLEFEKIAFVMQTDKCRQYDNIFIALGAFHIEQSLFGVPDR